ncbi:BRO family protein [Dermabacteraceae bacterium P13088]
MSDVQVFSSDQFGQVRTVERNGKVLFCGKDVAEALGYADTSKAIHVHCKG